MAQFDAAAANMISKRHANLCRSRLLVQSGQPASHAASASCPGDIESVLFLCAL